MSGADSPDAVSVLRNALAAQPDHSVVMIQVGFGTNPAHRLDDMGELDDSAGLVAVRAATFAVGEGGF